MRLFSGPDSGPYTAQWRFTRHVTRRRNAEPVDPNAILHWMTIMAAVLTVGLAVLLPAIYILPALSLVGLAAAAVIALLAWWTGSKRDARHLTAWDISGALAVIGFVAGMLSEPTHVLQFFGVTTIQ